MKLEIKKITGIALVAVLAYISMLIFKIPIQFLDFDIKDVIICIGGLIFGVVPAIIISFLVAFLELVTVSSSGLVGFFMNFTSTVFFVLPTVIIYKKAKKNVLIGVLIGTTLMTISMVLFNLIITPLYLGVSLKEVIGLLGPLIIPFNIGKGLINGIIITLLYKPVIQALNKSNLISIEENFMNFKFYHNNINVLDLEKSLKFYNDALNLKETKRITAEDGSFVIVYLGDNQTSHFLELTWLRDRKEPYNLGDNEFHIALHTDNYEEAFKKHKEMDCVCYVNDEMGIYFINDPDGYWIEILPLSM